MGKPVDVEFFPAMMDGGWTAQYNAARMEQAPELLSECLAAVVSKWNIHKDGVPLAITTESVLTLPMPMSALMLGAASEIARKQAKLPGLPAGQAPEHKEAPWWFKIGLTALFGIAVYYVLLYLFGAF